MSFLIGALGVLVAFGIVIFVHEFGHFIVAKKSGVKVDRFSFGLGPEMVGFQWGETRYCIAWIPLGGEVRMAGEMELEDAAADAAPEGAGPSAERTAKPRDPREFFALPWYRRIPIVVAGPAMNYVLSFVLFALIALAWGVPAPSKDPVIGDLAENYPAARAGLKSGDRIAAVGGEAVTSWDGLAARIHASAGKPLTFDVRRGSETLSVPVTPVADPAGTKGLIGITPAVVREPRSFGQSLRIGVQQCWGWSKLTLVYLGQKIVKREKPELSGPVGIASVIAKATKSGLEDYVFLIALISVGIGLFNLFPIPMLDGGHLAFFLYEGIFRRPPGKKLVQAANTAGLALLLTIFVFATYSDIRRLKTPAPAAEEKAK